MAGYSVVKIFALMLLASASGLPQEVSVTPTAQAKPKPTPAQRTVGSPLPLALPQNHYYPGMDGMNPNVPYPLSFRLTNGIGNALQATEFHLGGVPLPRNQQPMGSSASLGSAARAPFAPAVHMGAQSVLTTAPLAPAAPAPLAPAAPAPLAPAAPAPLAPAAPAPLAPIAPAPLAPAAPAPLAPIAPAPLGPIAPAPLAPIAPAPLAPIAPAPLKPIAPAPLAPAASAPIALAPLTPAPSAPIAPAGYNPTLQQLQQTLAPTVVSPSIVPKANALTKTVHASSTAPMMVLNLQELMKQGTTSGTSPHLPFIVIVPKDFALQNPAPKVAPKVALKAAPKVASPAVRPQRSVTPSVYRTDARLSTVLQQILAATNQAVPQRPERSYVFTALSK